MNNNRGQTLVMFVLIIPILLLILLLVVNIGNMVVEKEKMDGINDIALSYGLDNMEEDNVIQNISDIIKKNDDKIIIENIEIKNNKIYISTKKEIGGIVLGVLGINSFDIKESYVGFLDNNKKRIERNK